MTTWRRNVSIEPYGRFELESIGAEYVQGVQRAGGVVILIPHGDAEDSESLLRSVDGLVLIGGEDVDPALYGQENTGHSRRTNASDDEYEAHLVRLAHELGLPTLAICRGLQVANVALGGSLIQDLPVGAVAHQAPYSDNDELPVAHHVVHAEPGCAIASLYGADLLVNSIHHQAIDRLGQGLQVVARAEDGVVEAIESVDAWPLLGVQWHPEKLENGSALFQWLLRQARTRLGQAPS